jgi:hypothetical protein
MITALVRGENLDLEGVTSAATRLTEFSSTLVETKQNALVAFRRPGKLLPLNKFPVLLAEVSMLQCP